MKLAYAPQAVRDLIRLREFIAAHDPSAAARVGTELAERIEALLSFPSMGRTVLQSPDPEAVRDFVFGNYIVRYMTTPGALVVLRVWHHFEDERGAP